MSAIGLVLAIIWNMTTKAGLGSSCPNVNRWLGDIRTYFPKSVVQVMQKDALERLNLQQMLLEPETLETVEADIHLVGGKLLVAHSRAAVKPDRTLQSLYLDPMKKRISENGGRLYRNGPPVWLIVMVVSILVYALSYILIRTISRYREYAADRGSALITGAPEYLMSALQKISSQMTLIPNRDLRAVEGMSAFFIVSPKIRSAVGELFMDHPPIEKRLAALSEIAREMGRPVS